MEQNTTGAAWPRDVALLWGPYLAERQWGTVREDYSADGSAWDSFPHDMARSRAYRWGEDGLAGFCDIEQRLCLALALWNGRDPILKERLFGLTNSEGNHGEDCKELYFFLDATPTHTYQRMRYVYPIAAYPYAELVQTNRGRSVQEAEFELSDTGALREGHFDVEIEYAKAGPTDILMRITATNRSGGAEELHLLPHLWFRNTWDWSAGSERPTLRTRADGGFEAEHPTLGVYRCWTDGDSERLLCENTTNVARLYGVAANGPFKDGIHDAVIGKVPGAARREGAGTKGAFWRRVTIGAGQTATVRVRLTTATERPAWAGFDGMVAARRGEADAFFAGLHAAGASADEKAVQRQAWSGLLWSKQFYSFDVPTWLNGDATQPKPPEQRRHGRNRDWGHVNNADVLLMPDTWEYPWYAAWDSAFHAVACARVDPTLAKEQLVLLTREWYMHPSGQLPAYEWALGDVNPPVHAWAAWRVFEIDREQNGGRGDLAFLERVFHKLMLNFTWWVNRKDADGRNIFQGGFLGLDNIGVFDRSAPLPGGGHIDQADGTSWMAMYSLNLLRIALELSRTNHVYEDIATKFFEHFLHIAEAMNNMGGQHVGLWDERDQFFYDVWHAEVGRAETLRIRSMVGLIPLFAVEALDVSLLAETPEFSRRLAWYLRYRPELASMVSRWQEPGAGDRRLVSLLRAHRMKAVLRRMLDPDEFLSPYGIRSISKAHEHDPFVINAGGRDHCVRYLPAESDSGLFGGNSNWRGPVWMPVNFLIVESLRKFHRFYGETLKVEFPTRSGREMSLGAIADELSKRLAAAFLPGASGSRPVYGHDAWLDEHGRRTGDVLFYEYLHGDTGRGVGASHQTGWTALVAELLHGLKTSGQGDRSRGT